MTDEYLDGVLEDIQRKYVSSGRFPNIKHIIVADVTSDIKPIKEALRKIVPNSERELSMGEQIPLTYLELEKLVLQEKLHRKPPILSWKEYQVQYGSNILITYYFTVC